jgi:hypothetical protein
VDFGGFGKNNRLGNHLMSLWFVDFGGGAREPCKSPTKFTKLMKIFFFEVDKYLESLMFCVLKK